MKIVEEIALIDVERFDGAPIAKQLLEDHRIASDGCLMQDELISGRPEHVLPNDPPQVVQGLSQRTPALVFRELRPEQGEQRIAADGRLRGRDREVRE